MSVQLLLGDIIQIEAKNQDLNNRVYVIDYLDETKLRLIDAETMLLRILTINPDTGSFSDESIYGINILDHAPDPGYARQNGLLPNTWVDIYFGGEHQIQTRPQNREFLGGARNPVFRFDARRRSGGRTSDYRESRIYYVSFRQRARAKTYVYRRVRPIVFRQLCARIARNRMPQYVICRDDACYGEFICVRVRPTPEQSTVGISTENAFRDAGFVLCEFLRHSAKEFRNRRRRNAQSRRQIP